MKSQEPLKRSGIFEEKSSLVQRLRAVMIAVSVFILLGFVGMYLTTQPFLSTLKRMNAANITMTSISAALDSLETAEKEIEALPDAKLTKDVRFVFFEAQKLFKTSLETAIKHSGKFEKIPESLKLSVKSNEEFVKNARLVLKHAADKNKIFTKEELAAEILVARQYAQETRESLRHAFLLTKDNSDDDFKYIYAKRFQPILAALVISSAFLIFVFIFGFSITNRLRRALRNLSMATGEVAEGNLSYKAPILNEDELGHLTFAFNDMTEALQAQKDNLQTTADRIATLQHITGLFSEALTPKEIFSIIVDQGLKAVGAQASVIGTVSEDGNFLMIQKMEGYNYKFEDTPLSSPLPMAEVVRYGQPIFITSKEDLFEKYPFLIGNTVEKLAHAIMPLQVGSECLGSLTFSYSQNKSFPQDEKDYLIALTRQSAQALHRSQLFDDARQAIQARDEFLSIASHELRTPLTPLKLHLQGLSRTVKKEQDVPKEKILTIAETCDRQVTRLSRLIENLLDVSRISSGKLTLNKETFNLKSMIEEVVRHYADQLRNVETEIFVEAESGIEGFMDKVRIEQVLINFLTNAGKYAPGKPILIKLTKSDGVAKLSVKDQGPGILEHDQARVFERFERIKTGENIGGLGLGLYISKQIIEAHGGKISLESEIGSGSTFITTIPLFYEEPTNPNMTAGRFL